MADLIFLSEILQLGLQRNQIGERFHMINTSINEHECPYKGKCKAQTDFQKQRGEEN